MKKIKKVSKKKIVEIKSDINRHADVHIAVAQIQRHVMHLASMVKI